jgi:hypothetical protein
MTKRVLIGYLQIGYLFFDFLGHQRINMGFIRDCCHQGQSPYNGNSADRVRFFPLASFAACSPDNKYSHQVSIQSGLG